jgi:hypothetical protein
VGALKKIVVTVLALAALAASCARIAVLAKRKAQG